MPCRPPAAAFGCGKLPVLESDWPPPAQNQPAMVPGRRRPASLEPAGIGTIACRFFFEMGA